MTLRRTPAALLAISTSLALFVPFAAQAQQSRQQHCDPRAAACSTSSDHSDNHTTRSDQNANKKSQKAETVTRQTTTKKVVIKQVAAPKKSVTKKTVIKTPVKQVVVANGPRAGARVHNARYLSTVELRRLPKLPKGQGYRVQDNHVVRVSDDTQKILAVVGLMSVLLN
ncbi:MAG: hypothetical protein ABNH26_06985 [Celeribacter sp.]